MPVTSEQEKQKKQEERGDEAGAADDVNTDRSIACSSHVGVGWSIIALEKLLAKLRSLSPDNPQVQSLQDQIQRKLREYQESPVLQRCVPSFVRVIYHWSVVQYRLVDWRRDPTRIFSCLDRSIGEIFPPEIYSQARVLVQNRALLFDPRYICFLVRYLRMLAYFVLFDKEHKIRKSVVLPVLGQGAGFSPVDERQIFDAYVAFVGSALVMPVMAGVVNESKVRASLGRLPLAQVILGEILSKPGDGDWLSNFREHKERMFIAELMCPVFNWNKKFQAANDLAVVPRITSEDIQATQLHELWYNLLLVKCLCDISQSPQVPEVIKLMWQDQMQQELERHKVCRERIIDRCFGEESFMAPEPVKRCLRQVVSKVFAIMVNARQVFPLVRVFNVRDCQSTCAVELSAQQESIRSYYDAAKVLLMYNPLVESTRVNDVLHDLKAKFDKFDVSHEQVTLAGCQYDFAHVLSKKIIVEVNGRELVLEDVIQITNCLTLAVGILDWAKTRRPSIVICAVDTGDKEYCIQIDEMVDLTLEQIREWLEVLNGVKPKPEWFTTLPIMFQRFVCDRLRDTVDKKPEDYESQSDDEKLGFCAQVALEVRAGVNPSTTCFKTIPGAAIVKHVFGVINVEGGALFFNRLYSMAYMSTLRATDAGQRLAVQNLQQGVESSLVRCARSFINDWCLNTVTEFVIPVLIQVPEIDDANTTMVVNCEGQAFADLLKKRFSIEINGKTVPITPRFFSTVWATDSPASLQDKKERAKKTLILATKIFVTNIRPWLVIHKLWLSADGKTSAFKSFFESDDVTERSINNCVINPNAVSSEVKGRAHHINLVLLALQSGLRLLDDSRQDAFDLSWDVRTLVSLEQIIVGKTGLSWTICDASVDEHAVSTLSSDGNYIDNAEIYMLYTDAMLVFYGRHGDLPNLIGGGGGSNDREEFIGIFVSLLKRIVLPEKCRAIVDKLCHEEIVCHPVTAVGPAM